MDVPSVPGIAPESLRDRFAEGAALTLLDVREDDERGCCAIAAPAGVIDVHMPMSQIGMRRDELLASIAARPVVVYCHHGVRSAVVAAWLMRQGVDAVLNLDGGIDAWSILADPSVRRY